MRAIGTNLRTEKLRTLLAFGAVSIAGTIARPAAAWIYPEHRQIGLTAWQELPAETRAYYQRLWRAARTTSDTGWCETPEGAPTLPAGKSEAKSPCIDFAAWGAIAGDHACSPNELVESVLPSSWVHEVAAVSDRVRQNLAAATSRQSRQNVWITSNLDLPEVDDDYVTRAGANNAHFLLPRQGDHITEFMRHSSRDGAPLNALGLYMQYHAAAVRLAGVRAADGALPSAPLAKRVLALEAFALHFLQDIYSSGHVAGTWGDAPTRKGTHDYYCENGYATSSWSGHDLVMFGDANMRPADELRAASAVAASLIQVYGAAKAARERGASATLADPAAFEVAALDSCHEISHRGALSLDEPATGALVGLLQETPTPGHDAGSGAWPRYRADFGPFIGIESHLSVGWAGAGYGGSVPRPYAQLGMGVRFGYGLEGVVGSINTGSMYLDLGLVRQSEQVDFCEDDCQLRLGSKALPRVPSRPGVLIGLRLPFWLVPGDLLVLAPVLAIASPADLKKVAIRAASGGLIPWQRTFVTGVGNFEMIAGRVVLATIHGAAARDRAFAEYTIDGETVLAETGFRAINFTFPIVEYTPFRVFAQSLTTAMHVQLAYGVDLPFDVIRYFDGARSVVDWGPSHMFMLRLSIVGRHYL